MTVSHGLATRTGPPSRLPRRRVVCGAMTTHVFPIGNGSLTAMTGCRSLQGKRLSGTKGRRKSIAVSVMPRPAGSRRRFSNLGDCGLTNMTVVTKGMTNNLGSIVTVMTIITISLYT